MQKKIAWASWNEIEREITDDQDDILFSNNQDEDALEQSLMNELLMNPMISEMRPHIIHTPFGEIPADSRLKPSDRWDCWMGYTNFGITEEIQNEIQKVDGVDALKVMSRYSFCIGVAKLFKSMDVKKGIHNAICK